MKGFIATALIAIFGNSAKAQTNIKGDDIVYSSDFVNTVFTPKDDILKMLLSVKKFANGKQGIEFSFLIKPKKDMPVVNLDSIILTSADFHILPIHKHYSDTTYALMDLNLSYNTLHLIDDASAKFLKEDMISDITVFIDHLPVTIRLNKKTQRELNNILKSNL